MNEAMLPWLESQGLHSPLVPFDRVVDCANGPDCQIDDSADFLNSLREALEDEPNRKLFLYLPPEDDKFYQHPERWFRATLKSFPVAKFDIEAACKSYALELHTACVFHAMAVLQFGLHAMANDLGVSFKHSIGLAERQDVTAGIVEKIKPLRHMPKSDKNDETLTFFSGCAAQFRYLKDAWRNHLARMREAYDREQAQSILSHVRDFMEHVSMRLQE